MNQPLDMSADRSRADRRHNLVVLSDVHLGEDLMPGCPAETRRHVDMAETAMVDFIRHLARWRVDGRPWRLVINGDLADFMTVQVSPGSLDE